MESCSPTSDEVLHFLAQHSVAHLPIKDKVAVLQVCQHWRRAFSCSVVWQELDLRGSSNPAAWLRCCPGSPHWTILNAEFCMLRNSDLGALPGTLTVINLNGCREIDDEGIDILTQRCRSLKRVELYWNTRVTSTGISYIATRCPEIAHLNLSGCKQVGDDGILSLARHGAGQLTYLDLTRCPKLTDRSLKVICRSNPGITILNLYATVSVTDISCTAMAEALPQLERLDLCGATQVTDAGAVAVAEACPLLYFLNLTWVVPLTDESLVAIGKLTRLKWLSLFGIRGVTDAGLARLAAGACPQTLRTLDVNGCCGISAYRDRATLQALFPFVHTWVVHS